jgi:hypothetical protein
MILWFVSEMYHGFTFVPWFYELITGKTGTSSKNGITTFKAIGRICLSHDDEYPPFLGGI